MCVVSGVVEIDEQDCYAICVIQMNNVFEMLRIGLHQISLEFLSSWKNRYQFAGSSEFEPETSLSEYIICSILKKDIEL